MLLFYAALLLLTISLFVIAFLSLKLRRLSILCKNLEKNPTYDARVLLNDLTSGNALVKVTPINSSDFFLRSPRDRG